MAGGVEVTVTRVKLPAAARIQADMARLSRLVTKVGFPGGGVRRPADGLPVAAQAAIHEYGAESRGIPPRPFMHQALERNRQELKALKAGILVRIYRGSMDPYFGIKTIGEYLAGKIKESITLGDFKALKPSTILRKGSSRPLIDTGIMRASVTHTETEML